MRWNPDRGSPPAKVLVIQWRRLGDVVLALPAIDALRETWPGTPLHLLVSAPVTDLFAGDPRVAVLWTRPPSRGVPGLGTALRREGFDLVFDFQSLTATALLARGTGGTAVGYSKRARGRLYHVAVPPGLHRGTGYAADQKLDLLRAVGLAPRHLLPRLVAPTGPSAAWEGLPAGPKVALVPVSLRAAKRWPPQAFAETARRLHEATGAAFALLGGPGEDDAVHAVASRIAGVPHRAVALGRVADLVRALAGADLYLGNDNGPRHVAIALGVPTVAYFGPQNPTYWTPPGPGPHCVLWDRARAGNRPVREDLRIVPDRPEEAARAAAELLAARPAEAR